MIDYDDDDDYGDSPESLNPMETNPDYSALFILGYCEERPPLSEAEPIIEAMLGEVANRHTVALVAPKGLDYCRLIERHGVHLRVTIDWVDIENSWGLRVDALVKTK